MRSSSRRPFPTALRDGCWKGETALLHRDGHEIPVSQVILSHPDANGKIEFISTIIRDLSDRKQEEVARIEWANRYDAAIRASGQVLFDWNSFTNEITYAGDVERLFGYTHGRDGGRPRTLPPAHPSGGSPGLRRGSAADHRDARSVSSSSFASGARDASFIFIEAKGYFFLDRAGRSDAWSASSPTSPPSGARRRRWRGPTKTSNSGSRSAPPNWRLAYSCHRGSRPAAGGGGATRPARALRRMPLDALLEEAMQLVQSILRVDCCSLLALDRGRHGVRGRARKPAGRTRTSDNRVPAGHASQSGYTLLTGEPVIVEDLRDGERASRPRRRSSRAGVDEQRQRADRGRPRAARRARRLHLAPRKFVQDDVHFLQSVGQRADRGDRARSARKRASALAHEQAETASRAKSEFLSRMSHELRTPLNAILGFTQLLELEALSPSQAESVMHISRAGKHLLLLINEVLDIARIESGRLALSPEPIDLADFLREALDLIRPLADAAPDRRSSSNPPRPTARTASWPIASGSSRSCSICSPTP